MSSAKKNKKKGYDFEAEVGRGLDLGPQVINYKIPDSYLLRMATNLSVPSDFLFSLQGTLMTIEAKTTSQTRFPWRNISDHQVEWVLANPNCAFVVINLKKGREYNETYFVTAAHIKAWKSEYRASVPLDVIKTQCIELERFTESHHPEKEGAFISFKGVLW